MTSSGNELAPPFSLTAVVFNPAALKTGCGLTPSAKSQLQSIPTGTALLIRPPNCPWQNRCDSNVPLIIRALFAWVLSSGNSANDVYYSFTAVTGGVYRFDSCLSGYDTWLRSKFKRPPTSAQTVLSRPEAWFKICSILTGA